MTHCEDTNHLLLGSEDVVAVSRPSRFYDSCPSPSKLLQPSLHYSNIHTLSRDIAGDANSQGTVDDDDTDDEGSDDNDNDEDDDLMLPPLIRSEFRNRHDLMTHSKVLIYLDILFMNAGSAMFVVGSYLLYPEIEGCCGNQTCRLYAVELFLSGSLCFLLGTLTSAIQSRAYSCRDLALTCNVISYVIADLLFVFGSLYFLPRVEKYYGNTYRGLTLFIIGSLIFIIAPAVDLRRAYYLFQRGQVGYIMVLIETFVAIFYILGSALFIIGCVYFLPSLYHVWSITLFLIGSFSFQFATLIPPTYRLHRYLNRRDRQRKRLLRRRVLQELRQKHAQVSARDVQLPLLGPEKC